MFCWLIGDVKWRRRWRRAPRGFTILELLVVLAAIGLLLALAMPRYIAHVDHAREVALKHDLRAWREAIDRFHADLSRYPASLDELVARHYMRAIPADPITERRDTWVRVAPADGTAVVVDVQSGAPGRAKDGTAYASW